MDCALFDFSFLECVRLDGKRARDVIEAFAGRSLEALAEREICYALRIGAGRRGDRGFDGLADGPGPFEVMSGRREDVADLLACAGPGLGVTDMTADRADLRGTGPRYARSIAQAWDVGGSQPLRYFTFARADLAGISCTSAGSAIPARPGSKSSSSARHAAGALGRAVARTRPAGFVAADMLRIEAGFILFTNEFRLPVSPARSGARRNFRSADQCARSPKSLGLVSCRSGDLSLALAADAHAAAARPGRG